MVKRAEENLATLGEFGLIDRISRLIDRASASAPAAHRRVLIGPGDDAAVLRPRPGRDLVVTTDSLVENVHFRWETQPPRTIGRRALVANLSDLAAMGASPLGFVAALCAPSKLPVKHAEGLVKGLLDEAKLHACPLVGGNISIARETSVSITAFGTVAPGAALRRDQVKPGDRIFVTGTLGGAALAVARAEKEGTQNRRLATPRLEAGRALGRMQGVGGCIDISDGLLSDLEHLLAPPTLGARINPEAIPYPRGFAKACMKLGKDPSELALAGGEDYELLFTLHAKNQATPQALSKRLGLQVTQIGEATRTPGIQGPQSKEGWRHF